MTKNKRKRPQAQKNTDLMRAMQGLRQSSAASPHRNKARYTRKNKHKGQGWA